MRVEGFGELRRLGAGGLGDVYRATRLSTGASVAIKVLRDWSDSSVSWHRAKRELRALVELQGHPHVVHVEEVVEIDGVPLLVMEFAPGGSVAELLEGSAGGLSLGDVVLVGEQTASALAASHRLGIIHLDVKPQNLLVGAFGQVKVCDFGISALTQSEQFRERTSAVSFRYASPEQLNEEREVGSASDVFSLAATLAHLVNGVPLPVVAGDATRVGRPFVLGERGGVSGEAVEVFEGLLNECLVVDPGGRPSAGEVERRMGGVGVLLGDGRSRVLPVVVDSGGGTTRGEMVPRVITSTDPAGIDSSAAGVDDGVTVARPVSTDPTTESAPKDSPRSRYGAAIAIAATISMVASLVAVGFVLLQDRGDDAVPTVSDGLTAGAASAGDPATETDPASDADVAPVVETAAVAEPTATISIATSTTLSPTTTVPATSAPEPTIPPGTIEDGTHVGYVRDVHVDAFTFDRVDVGADGTWTNVNPALRTLPYSESLGLEPGVAVQVVVSDQRVGSVARVDPFEVAAANPLIAPGVIEDGVHYGYVASTYDGGFAFDRAHVDAAGVWTNNNPWLRNLPLAEPLELAPGTKIGVDILHQRVRQVWVEP